jgi:addiction module RelB/DinJ family antitoxin
MVTTTLSQTQFVQVRVDADKKRQVESVLSKLGISTSQAIKMFFNQIIMRKAIPFELSVPKGITDKEIDYSEVTPEELSRMAAYTFSLGETGDEPLNIKNPENLKPIDFSLYA